MADKVGKGNISSNLDKKRKSGGTKESKSKKSRKGNNNSDNEKDDTSSSSIPTSKWVEVGQLSFYLEFQGTNKEPPSKGRITSELKSCVGKKLRCRDIGDSYNMLAVQVGPIPGRRITNIWKYGGDAFLHRFLANSSRPNKSRIHAIIPENFEVLGDPKRKTWSLVLVNLTFELHTSLDLSSDNDKSVKRQVKQLINYLRGGSQPNPPKYMWPILFAENAADSIKSAEKLEKLMKKKTAKDWWK